MGGRRADHVRRRRRATRDVRDVARLGAARPGRRALPRRPRTPHGAVDARRPGAAGADRPRRGRPAAPRRRVARRHPVDRRAGRPAPARPGRPAHRPHPPLHPQRSPDEVEPEELADQVRARGAARRRLGQARRRLDRPRHRRPRPLLAASTRSSAAIAAAHEEGARVTAHCFGEDCLPDLARRRDRLHRARQRPAPTRPARCAAAGASPSCRRWSTSTTFPTIAEPASEVPRSTPRTCVDLHERALRDGRARAYEAGVPVYVGTDAGGSLPHGLVAQEVAELVAGRAAPDAEALDAACWGARAWLRPPGLEEGAPADLVVYDADPRADVAVLAAPRLVVLRGRPVA